MNISLVLERNSAEMAKDILHVGISSGSLMSTEVADGRHLCEDKVDNRNDDNGTDGVAPDDDDCDDGSFNRVWEVADPDGTWAGVELILATVKPAEDTEESGDGIDDEDSTDKLPVGPGLSTTSDEDEPVLHE